MMSAIVTGAAAPPAPTATRRPRGGLLPAVLRNRKPCVGGALLILFLLLAPFPHLFVPWLHGDPRAIGDLPLEHPSGKHWLGTPGLGPDVYAELLHRTRGPLALAVVAGAGATILSVIIGVSAAYLGGFADDGLSMLT